MPIRIKIDGNDPRLIPDLSASADVVIQHGAGPTPCSSGALSTENGKTIAYVKAGDTFEKREVSVGLQSDTHAVALAGLSAGDEVRLN